MDTTDTTDTTDTQPVSILLLGDAGVGKSTFLSRLRTKDNQDAPATGPLLRDADQPFVVELRSRARLLRLEFADTASPAPWRSLRPDLVVLCFDIGRRASLASLQSRWIKDVRTVFAHSDNLPVLVLGLKRDLRGADGHGPDGDDSDDAPVHPHEAYQLAQQLRADMYLECSAATGALVPQVLDDLCRRAVQTASGGGQSEGGCVVM